MYILYGTLSVVLRLLLLYCVFFFKQKTAYEMRISDWSSDVCSSDLPCRECPRYGTGSAVFPRPESVGAKSATVRRGESSSSRFRSGDLSPRNPASREPQPSSGGPECPAHMRSGAYPCSLPLRPRPRRQGRTG